MKYLAALLLVLVVSSPAPALEIKGNTIVLSPEEVAACANGCTLVTARALAEFRMVLIEAVKAAEQAAAVCKKGSI